MTRGASGIIWLAIVVHLCQGVAGWAGGNKTVTALAALNALCGRATGPVLIGVAGLAAVGMLATARGLAATVYFLPQQAVLTLGAYTALESVASGVYADGIVESPVFILKDQVLLIAFTAFHTVAILAKMLEVDA